MKEFLTELGLEARERPKPTLNGTIVASGVVIAVFGLAAIALDGYDGETSVLGIGLSLVAIAAGYAMLMRLDEGMRPAAITSITLGSIGAVGFAFATADTATIPLLLLSVAFIGQWAAGPARASTALLTSGLLSVWGFLVAAAAGDPSNSSFNDDPFGPLPGNSFSDGDDTVIYLSLIIGGLLLFGARVLDRDGWSGIATSAVIVGDVAFVAGIFGVVGTLDSDAFGSILILAAGVILAVVGATGERRFTTWLGGAGMVIGVAALLGSTMEDADGVQIGIVALMLGAGMVAAVVFVEMQKSSTITDEAATPYAPQGFGETVLAPNPTSQPTQPPVAPPAEQGWHADPTGRHELRWHDGTEWTANVSDSGQVGTDEGV